MRDASTVTYQDKVARQAQLTQDVRPLGAEEPVQAESERHAHNKKLTLPLPGEAPADSCKCRARSRLRAGFARTQRVCEGSFASRLCLIP